MYFRSRSLFSLILSCLLLQFTACTTDCPDDCAVDFDELSLLSNVGENIIFPAYEDLKVKIDTLKSKTNQFTTNPTVGNLQGLRTSFQNAWLSWQVASVYNFGPAEAVDLRAQLNTYPVTISIVDVAINSGNYDLTSPYYERARSFAALDYLLYGVAADEQGIVSLYSTDSKASERQQFTKDIVTHIENLVNQVYAEWSPSGANYLAEFTSTTGRSTGKPMSLLVNQINQSYEDYKNNKLGKSVGAKVGYAIQPDQVEALYSKVSLDLALASLRASEQLFKGGNSIGLDDYLRATGKKNGEDLLVDLILNQYSNAIAELEKIQPTTWSTALNQNNALCRSAYGLSQNLVVYLKTDLPMALCVDITYIDNTDDGD